MKLRWLGILAVGLLIAAADSKEEAVNKDLKKLEGSWLVVSFESNGDKMDEDAVKNFKLTITGDKYTFKSGDDTVSAGTMKPDPTQKPKSLDISVTEGDNSGQTLPAIYEIEGNQQKICFASPDKKRPTEFTAKADSGQTLITLKREKK